jgi:hypothetical protein
MRVLRHQESEIGRDAATFAIGALGGLAVGMLLSRSAAPPQRAAGLGRDLRQRVREAGERARSTARRLQPARLRRMAVEQAALTDLEDRVLDALLADATLSERGIDVGAISPGIVELSGSVWSEAEADEAVRLANRIPGVRTVVNRMEFSGRTERADRQAGRTPTGDGGSDTRWSGRGSGMSPRRQGFETDPGRSDDSQQQREQALRNADRDQWSEEGLAARGNPKVGESPEVQSATRADFREDELDNQDPHGKHGTRTLDAQPQKLNTSSRVGEGLKSATHLRMEQLDVDAKPHSERGTEEIEEPGEPPARE